MTKGRGYLLPSGDASEDELSCCLVFYPARDEYRRALMGSLDYLATWIAWERDSEKRGQDAAASWKLANIQTWECCNMGYCDDLLTTLQELLAATKALECCGDQDITDGRQYTDEIVDGVGNVPQNIIDAGYASGPSDWAGFDDYKCMISHLAVDHVESFFREIEPYISDTGVVIGGIGVVGALLGAILVVVGLPISAGIIVALGASAAIWTWILNYGKAAVGDLADEIAANHDALACAIYEGDGVTDSVSDFNDKVDELFSVTEAVAIKAVNFEPQLRAMYAGRYDQEDIAQKLADLGYELTSFDCTCETVYDIDITLNFNDTEPLTPEYEYRANWYPDGANWNVEGMVQFWANNTEHAYSYWLVNDLLTHAGESTISGSERLYIQYMEADWEPGPTCKVHGKFYAEGAYTADEGYMFDEGTYTLTLTEGNEIQLAGSQDAGEVCPAWQMVSVLNDRGGIHRLRIAGYIDDAS